MTMIMLMAVETGAVVIVVTPMMMMVMMPLHSTCIFTLFRWSVLITAELIHTVAVSFSTERRWRRHHYHYKIIILTFAVRKNCVL